MNFPVELDVFRGPLDLLLYLVRKHEVDITEIPIAQIAEQFIEHLDVLEAINIDAVGEFLDMASLLLETKSRLVLPRVEEEAEQWTDPREGLVEQLLSYKRYKDAAGLLEARSLEWQQQRSRLANDLPARRVDASEQPIREVELWDLVSALGRIMREKSVVRPASVVYDETPIHVYMGKVQQRLNTQEKAAFSDLFDAGVHKSAMIGIFLAILELIKRRRVHVEQSSEIGEIWVSHGEQFDAPLDLNDLDEYEG